MKRNAVRVAVLGAGIMGSAVALFLARRGVEVTLVDAAPAAFSGASRWNEGKIHLGYLYAGDETMATAHKVLPGGLGFKTLTEELIGTALDEHVTRANDIYLAHRDTVVPPSAMERYLRHVAQLVRAHPDASRYLVDVSGSDIEALDRREIAKLTDPEWVSAGFRVPERSVDTQWVADRFVDALAAQAGIVTAMSTRVTGVVPTRGPPGGGWTIACRPSIDTCFDGVVNALWEGGPAVDATVGLLPEGAWSHRYRLSLFVRTSRVLDVRSAVLVTGPFGDMKNYDGRHFYLSWYDAGLVATGSAVAPPALPVLDAHARQRRTVDIVEGLGTLVPAARHVMANAEETRLEGGWVFAIGEGSLADRRATLHRRARFGVRRRGTYFSVDTGKYSTAPWLARRLADEITARIR